MKITITAKLHRPPPGYRHDVWLFQARVDPGTPGTVTDFRQEIHVPPWDAVRPHVDMIFRNSLASLRRALNDGAIRPMLGEREISEFLASDTYAEILNRYPE